MTASQRVTIAVRGTAYGVATGAFCGALAGGVLALATGLARPGRLLPLLTVPLFGGVVGALLGLGAGAIGGLVFALGAHRLAGRPRATRLAGAALVPSLLITSWVASRTAAGRSVVPSAAALPVIGSVFFLLAWIGGPAGALVAPLVLHGPRRARAAMDRGTRRPAGDRGADSSG